MNNNDIISCSEMIMNAFSSIEKESFENNSKLISVWKKIITKIKNDGQKLYEHSSVIEIKNGILLVESDHPGWIQLFQMNSKFIVKGFSIYAPELNIKSVAFRLKGSNALLCDVNYDDIMIKERQKMKEKYEKEEKILQRIEKKDENKSTEYILPPELTAKFESMKNSMLTKNENK